MAGAVVSIVSCRDYNKPCQRRQVSDKYPTLYGLRSSVQRVSEETSLINTRLPEKVRRVPGRTVGNGVPLWQSQTRSGCLWPQSVRLSGSEEKQEGEPEPLTGACQKHTATVASGTPCYNRRRKRRVFLSSPRRFSTLIVTTHGVSSRSAESLEQFGKNQDPGLSRNRRL